MEKILLVLDMKSKSNHVVYHDHTDDDDLQDAIEYALGELNIDVKESVVGEIWVSLAKMRRPYLVKGRYSFELLEK